MKFIGYTALHYGREYLAWAIRSVVDHLDEYHVLYTAVGSHGSRTDVRCPETRDELYAIAVNAAGDKLRWHDGEWPHEGAQRDSIQDYVPDADVILVLDADEIWPESLVMSALYHLSKARLVEYRNWRVPIIHYWRNFYKAVLRDPAYPIRVIYPQIKDSRGEGYIRNLSGHEYINHFGYAQTPAIVQYKQLTHGHRGEWRRDINWYQDRFLANAQHDCHPVGSEYWNPETVNPLKYMPAFMVDHPFFHKGLIE